MFVISNNFATVANNLEDVESSDKLKNKITTDSSEQLTTEEREFNESLRKPSVVNNKISLSGTLKLEFSN